MQDLNLFRNNEIILWSQNSLWWISKEIACMSYKSSDFSVIGLTAVRVAEKGINSTTCGPVRSQNSVWISPPLITRSFLLRVLTMRAMYSTTDQLHGLNIIWLLYVRFATRSREILSFIQRLSMVTPRKLGKGKSLLFMSSSPLCPLLSGFSRSISDLARTMIF